MQRIPFTILLTSVCLFLTGCFEVIEEITYSSAESGTFLMTVNCSKSKTKLKALAKLDTFMGMNIPKDYEIYDYLDKARQAVKDVPGTSEVSYTLDMDNYIATMTFRFDKTETLNKALNAVAQSGAGKTKVPYQDVYSYSSQVFKRQQVPSDSVMKSLQYKNEHLALINGARATSIYRFHQPVNKASNPKSNISKNRKAVMLQQDITEIIRNPSIFTNTISF